MSEDFIIRTLRKEDCIDAARLHFELQNMELLPSLGVPFYIEWLKGICESKWSFGLVCTDREERIVGFECATVHLRKLYGDIILRRGFFLAFWTLPRIIKKPELLGNLLRYSKNYEKNSLSSAQAEWLSLVVANEYRGRGLGKKLTLALIDEFRRRGVKEFLSPVSADNTISCSLHDKNGFELLGTFESHGKKNLYRYCL